MNVVVHLNRLQIAKYLNCVGQLWSILPGAFSQVKSNDRLAEVLGRSLAMIFGSSVATSFHKNIQQGNLCIPSAPVLSRSRLMLDVILCLHRQQQWPDPSSMFLYLSMDSSPQNGFDYLMTLLDRVTRTSALQLIRSIDEEEDSMDLDTFLASGFFETSVLPLGIIGSGNSGVAAKFECLFHCLKLECGAEAGQGDHCNSLVELQ